MSEKWKEALADAKEKLFDGKIYVARMKAAIRIIERRIEEDAPWPGEK